MSENAGVVEGSEWRELFDRLTKELAGNLATIEIISQEFGDDYEAERLPLAYLEYDPKDDMFIVGVGGRDGRYPVILRHFVEHPKSINLDTVDANDSLIVEVTAEDDSRTLLTIYRSSTSGERA